MNVPEPAKPMSSDPTVAGSAASAPVSPEQFLAAFQAKPSHEIQDADLATLASMTTIHPQITELNLKGAPITKAGLGTLALLPALRSVDLTSSTIIGDDWAPLASAVQIESLNLESASVSDTSLAVVAPLVNLRQLNLIVPRSVIRPLSISQSCQSWKKSTLRILGSQEPDSKRLVPRAPRLR